MWSFKFTAKLSRDLVKAITSASAARGTHSNTCWETDTPTKKKVCLTGLAFKLNLWNNLLANTLPLRT